MSTSMVGTTLQNRYRMEYEIGRGGMSTVYCAYDTDLERNVAIKLMSSTELGTEGRNQLLREARAIARLNHPLIVTIYDINRYNLQGLLLMFVHIRGDRGV
jgi:serine/threonine protein kinase